MMEELKLADEVEECREHIIEALTADVPGAWPADESIIEAEQPELLARAIIPALHMHLMNAKIAFLFKKSMSKGEKTILGKASKASAKLQFLAQFDFVIEFNWEAWRDLPHTKRVALVDHELSHCGYDIEHGKYVMVEHDVEEFGSIVKRWGLWKSDLVSFGRRCAEQIHLFDEDTTVTLSGDEIEPITMKANDFSQLVDEVAADPKKLFQPTRIHAVK